jgi:hypothetical protein
LGYAQANSAFGGTAPLLYQSATMDRVTLFIGYITVVIGLICSLSQRLRLHHLERVDASDRRETLLLAVVCLLAKIYVHGRDQENRRPSGCSRGVRPGGAVDHRCHGPAIRSPGLLGDFSRSVLPRS